MTRNFDVFCFVLFCFVFCFLFCGGGYLRLNKQLSKQSWGWRFETPSRSLWRHCNEWNQHFKLPENSSAISNNMICGPFHERFFHRNSNLMANSFWFHPNYSEVIAIKVCTWYDSSSVVPCEKNSSDLILNNDGTLKPIFHRFWSTVQPLFVKLTLYQYELHKIISSERYLNTNILTL